MNRITQEASSRQAVVKLAIKKGKSFAARKYGVSLSSVKRWYKRYDGTWESLKERSHRPKSHPRQHTAQEEALIRQALNKSFFRYGWDGAYMTAKAAGYTRSYSGFIYAARRMELCGGKAGQKPARKHDRRYPELSVPGEKVQIDVKEVPYCCLKGAAKRDGKHLYHAAVLLNAHAVGIAQVVALVKNERRPVIVCTYHYIAQLLAHLGKVLL